MKKEPFQ